MSGRGIGSESRLMVRQVGPHLFLSMIFSILHTLFYPDHLLGNISWLIGKLSKNKGMGCVSIGYERAWWTARNDGKFETYAVVEIMEMIEYLVRHAYIKPFGSIFR